MFRVILASADSRSEDVVVLVLVVPELELCNVKWQILDADLVEGSDHATLEDAPEAFNRVRMHRADNVLEEGSRATVVMELQSHDGPLP